MQEKINKHINDIQRIKIISNEDVEKFKKTYLSKSGILNNLFLEFKNLTNDQKKESGILF